MKFAVIFQYGNADQIPHHRPEHRAYLKDLQASGRLAAAGPFEDDSGALIVYEAESAEQAESLIRNDPFYKVGVFAQYTIKPWRQVL